MAEEASVEPPHEDGGTSGRRSRMRLVSDAALAAAWPPEGTTTLRDIRDRHGRSLMTIEEHAQAGYRLNASHYGQFAVTADGGDVLCAPTPIADWEWQAFLIGQVLPLITVLHGLEAVHGSAVAYGDDAIGLVAHSCGGKSSLAVNLVRRGAAFVADDALAVERSAEGITVHCGPALASVRRTEVNAIGPQGIAELGIVVGENDHELRVAVPLDPRPRNLAALYFLESAEHEPRHAVEAIDLDPQLLLCSSHKAYVRTPARLIGQLDLYAHLARSVPIFRAVVWPGIDAHGLAGVIRDHALDTFARAA